MDKLKSQGLTIAEEYITDEEEDVLLYIINAAPWKTDLHRKTQQYGFKYNYSSRSADPTTPMPEWLEALKNDIYPQANSCIINHYAVAQGISPHIDNQIFGDKIVTLSLGSTCAFVLTDHNQDLAVELFLKPRTLLIMSDDVRRKWFHCIPPRKRDYDSKTKKYVNRTERISVTFRFYPERQAS